MLRRGKMVCLAFALQIIHLSALRPEPIEQIQPGIGRANVFADFEDGVDGWRVDFRELAGGQVDLARGQLEAPPLAESKAYLYMDFRSRLPTGVRLRPVQPVRYTDFVQRMEFWLLNGGNLDEVAVDLLDARGKRHRVSLGRANSSGWQKFSLRIPPEVQQRSAPGSETQTGLSFVGLYFSPVRRAVGGDEFSLFSLRVYADHFIAFTRAPHRRPEAPAWSRLRL